MPRKIHHQIIHTYKQETASIPAGVIVVHGTADGQVKLPGAADVGDIVGVTKYAGDATVDSDIEVVVSGFADVLVKGANILRGSAIGIHGTSGYGKLSALTNAKWVLGFATEATTVEDTYVSVEIAKFATPSA